MGVDLLNKTYVSGSPVDALFAVGVRRRTLPLASAGLSILKLQGKLYDSVPHLFNDSPFQLKHFSHRSIKPINQNKTHYNISSIYDTEG